MDSASGGIEYTSDCQNQLNLNDHGGDTSLHINQTVAYPSVYRALSPSDLQAWRLHSSELCVLAVRPTKPFPSSNLMSRSLTLTQNECIP